MPSCWVVMFLVFAVFCFRTVDAAAGIHALDETLESELLFDRSEPPSLGWIVRRGDGLESRDSQSGYNGLQVADQGSQIPLPQPFDSSLGNNFTTDTCPQFFDDFLTNQTFLDCLPFSLLLQVRLNPPLIPLQRTFQLTNSPNRHPTASSPPPAPQCA